ncbi:MAG: extracellular solute-binding protein [Firmicutes bacterium]|nr:extracellular solute-binding protein [Bacillota bacterium]
MKTYVTYIVNKRTLTVLFKLLNYILLLCFVILFSGCAGNLAETKKDYSEPEIVISIVPQNDQPVSPDSPVMKECERILGVRFEFIYFDRNRAKEFLNLHISSGQIPDIMNLNNEQFNAYTQQGVLAAIPEEKLQRIAPTIHKHTLLNLGENAWNLTRLNGEIYGIPVGYNSNGIYHFVPIWRDDWLWNVGIYKIPETLLEAEAAFYKFAHEDPDGNGVDDTYALSNTGFSTVFGAFGGIPFQSVGGSNSFTWTIREDGTVVATAVMPEMKDALTLLNKWHRDGLIDPEFISGENKGTYWANSVSFQNGRIGFSVPGHAYHVAKPFNEKDAASDHYFYFKALQGDDASYVEGRPLIGPDGLSGTEMWGVYSGGAVSLGKGAAEDSRKMDKILEMYELTNTDYAFGMMAQYGFEGVHYEIDPDVGLIYIGEATDSNFRARLGLGTNGFFRAPANYKLYPRIRTKYMENMESHKYVDKYINPIWGGLPSYPQYKALIKKMIIENYTLFISGERDISEFDLFVEELYFSGLWQLTEEANEWYRENQSGSER